MVYTMCSRISNISRYSAANLRLNCKWVSHSFGEEVSTHWMPGRHELNIILFVVNTLIVSAHMKTICKLYFKREYCIRKMIDDCKQAKSEKQKKLLRFIAIYWRGLSVVTTSDGQLCAVRHRLATTRAQPEHWLSPRSPAITAILFCNLCETHILSDL